MKLQKVCSLSITKIKLIAFLIIVICLWQGVQGLSNSIVTPNNVNFRTGINSIVQTGNASSYITTSATIAYTIAYGATMSTVSLNATLGVMSSYFPMNSLTFGWNIKILSLNDTAMDIEATAVLDQVTFMKINFMVSSYPPISANYLQYNFSKIFFIIRCCNRCCL